MTMTRRTMDSRDGGVVVGGCMRMQPALERGCFTLFVETFHPDYISSPMIRRTLQAIAEPVSRPRLVHEYLVTPYSIGAAVSMGHSAEQIIDFLQLHLKVNNEDEYDGADDIVDDETAIGKCDEEEKAISSSSSRVMNKLGRYIRDCVASFGRASAVMYGDGSCWIEASEKRTIAVLLKDTIVRSQTKVNDKGDPIVEEVVTTTSSATLTGSQEDPTTTKNAIESTDGAGVESSSSSSSLVIYRFLLIDIPAAKYVAQRALALGYPLQQHYDYTRDRTLPDIPLVLRASTKPREYQLQAVSAVVGTGRCTSGVVVLPCGAGKTLVGILLMAAVKKPAIVLCASSVSVEQWKNQILEYAGFSQQEQQQESSSSTMSTATTAAGGVDAKSSSPATGTGGGNGVNVSSSSTSRSCGGRARGRGGTSTVIAAPSTSNIPQLPIACVTGKTKDPITDSTSIVITTYTMLSVAYQLVERRRNSSGRNPDGENDDNADVLFLNDGPEEGDNYSPQRPSRGGRGNGGGNPSSSTSVSAALETTRANKCKVALMQRSYGLMILDEAHVVPAEFFKDAMSTVQAKATVGLTATFVREDHRITHLHHLVGPKLFDVSWEELCARGYLARVTCVEVHCPMSSEFGAEYATQSQALSSRKGGASPRAAAKGKAENNRQKQQEDGGETGGDSDDTAEGDEDESVERVPSSAARRKSNVILPPAAAGSGGSRRGSGGVGIGQGGALYAMAAGNPKKFDCVYRILQRHKNAKVLIFCDFLLLLKEYSKVLKVPMICGETAHKDRMKFFSDFQSTRHLNVLCVSRVGDVSVNLPSASVVIQVSSQGGSRRQEAQRLGRILRPKDRAADGSIVHAYFYTLVSEHTVEGAFASRRSRFLINQGYDCRVVQYPFDDHGECSDEPEGDAVAAAALLEHLEAQEEVGALAPKSNVKLESTEDAHHHRQRNVGAPQLGEGLLPMGDRRWRIEWLAKVVSQWEWGSMSPGSGTGSPSAGRKRGRAPSAKGGGSRRSGGAIDDDDGGSVDDDETTTSSSSDDSSVVLVDHHRRSAVKAEEEQSQAVAAAPGAEGRGRTTTTTRRAFNLGGVTYGEDDVVYHEY